MKNNSIFEKSGNSDSAAKKWFVPAISLAIGLFTFVVYLKAITFGFVDWDDNDYVLNNPLLSQNGWDFIFAAFTSMHPGNWHPLTNLSYKFDYMIWGLDPMGYHLTNIALHAIATGLVFWFGYKLLSVVLNKETDRFRLFFAAFVCAMLFGIHPLHVESVAWVSERKDVLCAVFYVLCLLFYIRYKTGESASRGGAYAYSLFFCVLSMMSKPMAVSIPVTLLILDFYPLGRLNSFKNLISEAVNKVPFIMLSLAVSLTTIMAQKSAIAPLEVKPMSVRAAHMFQTYVFYLEKTVFPNVLMPFYPHSVDISLWSGKTLLAISFFGFITAIGVMYCKKRPYFLAAWAFYVITLLPVIGIVQVGGQVAADRYMYLPSLSLFLLVGAALAAFYGYREMRVVKAGAIAIAAAIVILLTMKTSSQINIWRDDYSFWTHELSYVGKGNADAIVLSRIKRGYYFFRINRLDEAIIDYNEGIKANPKAWNHYVMRGNAFQRRNKKGDMEKAEIDFKTAVLLNDTKDPWAYRCLALLYVIKELPEKVKYYSTLGDRVQKGERLPAAEIEKAAAPLKLQTIGPDK
ncbi:MAG: hypothetical protein OEV59_03940 [Deltaproteobacteria bacterium]|nr:hypothetical protein [Deltaproteobacteria bacterium]